MYKIEDIKMTVPFEVKKSRKSEYDYRTEDYCYLVTEKGFSYGGTGEIPKLTDEDVIEVSYRYINLYELLTGKEFEFPSAHPRIELLSKLQQAGLISGGLAVIMAGSDSDMPHIEKIQKALDDFNVKSEVRICSAHKQPGLCESIVKKYNNSLEPVVIIAVAGGTDALSGVASFHSVFPVISCPPKAEEYHSGIKNCFSGNCMVNLIAG